MHFDPVIYIYEAAFAFGFRLVGERGDFENWRKLKFGGFILQIRAGFEGDFCGLISPPRWYTPPQSGIPVVVFTCAPFSHNALHVRTPITLAGVQFLVQAQRCPGTPRAQRPTPAAWVCPDDARVSRSRRAWPRRGPCPALGVAQVRRPKLPPQLLNSE